MSTAVRFRRLSNPDWSRASFGGRTYTIKPVDRWWFVMLHRTDGSPFGDMLLAAESESEARAYVRSLAQ